jgi:hypothetical protein
VNGGDLRWHRYTGRTGMMTIGLRSSRPRAYSSYVAVPQHMLGRPHLTRFHHPLRQSAHPILLLPAHRSVRFPAALRKQEAARGSEKLRGPVRVMCPAQSTKSLKTAERRKQSVVPGSTRHTTQNLKVTGSNPVPATNIHTTYQTLTPPGASTETPGKTRSEHRGSTREWARA